jgi:hypothetical protein
MVNTYRGVGTESIQIVDLLLCTRLDLARIQAVDRH